jgi:hypothetical protein
LGNEKAKRRLEKSDHVKSCLLPKKAAGYKDLTAKLGSEETIYSGNPLWLIGVYAPIGQKLFFKISKNSEKKFLACI